jgi:hypothetical protein
LRVERSTPMSTSVATSSSETCSELRSMSTRNRSSPAAIGELDMRCPPTQTSSQVPGIGRRATCPAR